MLLSPIPETDSSKMTTIDSHGQTQVRIHPDEERKLTGTGKYDVEAFEYDNDYYSDDFESDDEEEEGSSIMTSGCSGSTVDTQA